MSIFKTKPRYSYKVGGGAFRFDFYIDEKNPKGNYLHITTPSGVFEQKVRGYAFGYLLAASQQGKVSELEAYGLMLYRVSDEIYQDLGFCQDIIKAITKHDKRLIKQGEAKAKAVTETDEIVAQSVMEDLASEVGMSEKELKAKRKADKEILREVLNEKENENGE